MAMWDGNSGWVTTRGIHYKIIPATAETQFLQHDTIPELLDSRSFGSTAAQYTELEPD
jgi:hypothetical protein